MALVGSVSVRRSKRMLAATSSFSSVDAVELKIAA